MCFRVMKFTVFGVTPKSIIMLYSVVTSAIKIPDGSTCMCQKRNYLYMAIKDKVTYFFSKIPTLQIRSFTEKTGV